MVGSAGRRGPQTFSEIQSTSPCCVDNKADRSRPRAVLHEFRKKRFLTFQRSVRRGIDLHLCRAATEIEHTGIYRTGQGNKS